MWIPCQECKGTRYDRHTLEIKYKCLNISEILDLDVKEALTLFKEHSKITRVLKTLDDVGLGYIKLGQSATTLSGGEAQRVARAYGFGTFLEVYLFWQRANLLAAETDCQKQRIDKK